MKKYIRIILLAAVSVLFLGGCKDIKAVKDIKVTSAKVEAVSPQGFTGLNVFLAVGIDNPSFQIGLEDIDGSLKHSGKILGKLAMDPFVLQAHSAEIYHLRAVLTKGEEASIADILKLTDMAVLNECKVDVSVKARLKSGVAAPIEIKDIPVKKLLERASNEKN